MKMLVISSLVFYSFSTLADSTCTVSWKRTDNGYESKTFFSAHGGDQDARSECERFFQLKKEILFLLKRYDGARSVSMRFEAESLEKEVTEHHVFNNDPRTPKERAILGDH